MGERSVEDLTIVGAFAPRLRSSTWLTLQLAAGEVGAEQVAGNLESLEPLMVVLCDDGPETIDDAMEHLVGRLGARAIVASFDDTTRVAAVAGAGDRAFLLSPDGALGTPLTASYWHLGGDHRAIVPIYTALFDGLTRSFALRPAPPPRPYRLAFVIGSREDDAVASLVEAALVFDGLSAGELGVQDRLRSFRLAEEPSEREETVADLIRFMPDVVLAFTSGSFSLAPRRERAEVIGRIEAASAASTGWVPLYIIGPRRAGDAHLESLARENASFRARAVNVDVGLPGRAEEAALRARFAEQYPRAEVTDAAFPSARIYDAFYYLVYAAAAGRGFGSIGSERLRSGLARITNPSGPAVYVGTGSAGLELGDSLLGAGSPLDLHGVTGAGQFDTALQTRNTAPAVYCWAEDGLLAPWSPAPAVLSAPAAETLACASELSGAGFY